MDLGKCLENLRHDLTNGGIEDDSFAMNCYITMVNEANRIMKNSNASPKDLKEAEEYINLCANSGIDSLMCIVRG